MVKKAQQMLEASVKLNPNFRRLTWYSVRFLITKVWNIRYWENPKEIQMQMN